MFQRFFALFIIIPLIELALLIKVGEYLGVWNTIALVVLTALVGAFMMRLEGLRVWYNIQNEMMSGLMPTDNMIDGVLILIGGILLLTPGILTDLIGLSLLLPFTRILYRNFVKKKMQSKVRQKAQVIEIKTIDNK